MGYDDYLAAAVERAVLAEHPGRSGAALERLLLADGRRLIVKRFDPATDLAMALTGDDVGREYQLWSTGVLDRLPPQVEHAVVDGWREAETTVVVMRDLGATVLDWSDRLSRERCRWLLERVATIHRAFLGRPPRHLTPLPEFLAVFAPHRVRAHVSGENPLAAIVLRGWEIFADTVPSDVADPVLSMLTDPGPLVRALESRPATMVHGDLATVNMAIEDDRLTLLDWSMPAAAPGAVDVARFIAGCASVVEATREQLIADYAQAAGPAYDEASMRLGLLSALMWLGWNKAVDAVEHPDPESRERERLDLAWWVARARLTLETGLL